jgi:hypothetical protein
VSDGAWPVIAPERVPPPPLAVYRGRRDLDALGWTIVLALALAGAGLGALGVPRATALLPPFVLGAGFVTPVVTVVLVALGAFMRFAGPRSGTTEVHADRVVVLRSRATVVFLRDVLAFDDGSGDLVDLHVGRERVAVPTGGADRSTLLGLLVARGIPRTGDAAPALGAPPPRPLLELPPDRRALGWLDVLWAPGRRADLRFLEDRIEFAARSRPLAVGWDDVVGWTAGWYQLRLVLRSGPLRRRLLLTVPTPDGPTLRAAVDLFAARGVPRVG